MATYNGHKNWTYWNVSLWIDSDYGLYRVALESLTTESSHTAAARRFLAHLAESGETHTPDGAKYTVRNVYAALHGQYPDRFRSQKKENAKAGRK